MRIKGCITKRQSCAFALAVLLALAPMAASALGGTSGKVDPRVYLRGAGMAGAPVIACNSTSIIIPSAIMTLHITCSCPDYNYVGKQWSQYFSIDDMTVKSGSKLLLETGQTIVICTEITEYDDKYDDIAEDIYTRQITADDLLNGFIIERPIEVVENGGQYEGHIAEWTVTYTFSP